LGERRWGFGGCGILEIKEASACISFPLLPVPVLRYITFSMNLLTMALVDRDEQPRVSNREQQLDLNMRCELSATGYGHAVGGYLSTEVISWLRKVASAAPKNQQGIEIPAQVLAAMRSAWCAATSLEGAEWSRECRGYIWKDGRLSLICFGDACDLSIYPEHVYPDERDFPCAFSCHNLDTAPQQVTLLAGLATICALARA